MATKKRAKKKATKTNEVKLLRALPEVEWGDLPPAPAQSRRSEYTPLLDALKEFPGSPGKIATFEDTPHARNAAAGLHRRYKDRGFEVVARGCDIWATFTE